MTECRKIVTHVRPHLDEILAILLLRKFGEERFPGASTAHIELWDAGPFTPDGRPVSDYEKEGVLLIGVGGSRFDEHATLDENRREGECAASLMARELGLNEDPCFEQLLKYVTGNDTRGGAGSFTEKSPRGRPRDEAGAFHLAALVGILNRKHPHDANVVIEWASTFLEAYIEQQMEFHRDVREAYERDAVIEEIPVSETQAIRLVSIRSDLESIGQFSRSRMAKGGPADVFVQQRTSGQVQIFTNRKSPVHVDIRDIVQVIRLKEQRAKGAVVTTGFEALSAEGTVAGSEEWYFHESGGCLLNGSLSAPTVPATRLSLAFILEMIRACLNPKKFQKEHKKHCLNGRCTNNEDPCSWYDYGLHRCRKMRYDMKNAVIPAKDLVRKPNQSAPQH